MLRALLKGGDVFRDLSKIWIHVVTFHLAGCWMLIRLAWTLHANFSTKFFHTSHAYRHHWLPQFYTTFCGLFAGGHLLAPFLHFSAELDEIWFGDQRCKFNIPIILLSEIYWIKGDLTIAVLLTTTKTQWNNYKSQLWLAFGLNLVWLQI